MVTPLSSTLPGYIGGGPRDPFHTLKSPESIHLHWFVSVPALK